MRRAGAGPAGAVASPWVPAAIAAGATLLFLWPWWNRFLGVTLDGYFPHYGSRIAAGETPYRDFFLHLPPLQALAHAGLEQIFGRHLILGRAAGALARMALAGLLAAWLARRFRSGTAVVSALAAVWLASGDDTEILDLYNHHALLAALVAGLAAGRALVAGGRRPLFAAISGFAASLAFWTKQTIGLGVTVAVPLALVLVLLRSREDRDALVRGLAAFAAGWSLPTLVLCAWLAGEGSLGPFFQQVFVDAAGSKGSIWSLLARPWIDPFTIEALARPARLGALGAVVLAVSSRGRGADGGARGSWRAGLVAAAAAGGVALAAGHALAATQLAPADLLRAAQRTGVFFASFGILVPAIGLALRALARPLDARDRQLLLLALVGAGTGAALALSWPGGEAIALPGLGVVLGLVLDAEGRSLARRAVRVALAALVAAAVTAAVALKLLVPFDFALWREPPVAKALLASGVPALAGLRLAPETVRAVDGVVGALDAWTGPEEPVLVFPAMPIFYWLAERRPATFAAVHWIDVAPDRIVDADLERVLAEPPVAVVRAHVLERSLEVNESYFRADGVASLRRFQRRLIALLDARYVLVFSSRGAPGARQPLEVWVRGDRFAERGSGRPEG